MKVNSLRLLPLFLFYLALGQPSLAQIRSVIQKGHDAVVKTVAFSPDGKFVATGSRDKSIKLWEMSSGREIRTFLGHQHTVNHVTFSRDGKFLASSSADQTAKVWNIESGGVVFTTPKEAEFMTAVAFSADGKLLATGGYAREVKIWNLKTHKVIDTIAVNPEKGLGYGIQLQFSDDGRWLAIGEDNRTTRVFRVGSWQAQYSFEPTVGWCGGCASFNAFSPDGLHLAKQSHNDTLRIFSLETGEQVRKLGGSVEEVIGVAYHPQGKALLVGTTAGIITWDLATDEVQSALPFTDDQALNGFSISKNGQWIATGHNDNQGVIWDFSTAEQQLTLSGILNSKAADGLDYDPNNYWQSHIARYLKYKNELTLAPGGAELIRGKFGTLAKAWSIADGQTKTEYIGHEKAVLSQALSPDGEWLATGGGEGQLIIWKAGTGEVIQTIKAHREPIFQVRWSHDQSMVVTGSWDGTAKVWDSQTGERLQYIDFQNQSPYVIDFSPNDLYLVAGLLDKSLQLFEIDTRQSVRQFVGHTEIVSSLHFLPNGQLVTASWDGSIRLWEVSSGLMVRKFKDHEGAVYGLAISADGKTLISGGADRMLRVWDIQSGQLMHRLSGHQADIVSVVMADESDMIISASLDGVTKIWDFSTKQEFFEHIHISSRDWMVKTREGYFNATNGARENIHFVDGLKSYEVEQFFEDFYRPDLVPLLFKSRGGGEKFQGLNQRLEKSPPPAVKMGALKSGEPGHANLYFRIIDQGGGLDEIKITHNGKRIDTKGLTLLAEQGDTSQYQMKVALVAGENRFSTSAFSTGRVESTTESMSINSDFGARSAHCYILSIGINQYLNPQLNLNYAKSDASAMVEVLEAQSQEIFEEIHLFTLYDEEAKRDRIMDQLDRLAEMINPEDVFIFYYAGHGSMVDNEFYFIPSDNARLYENKSLEKYAIRADRIQEKFQQIKALKQLIIMDACQSGGSVELLAQRGATEEKAMAQLSRSAGIHVMAAAGSEQFATEFAHLGHGLFTYVLLEALNGAADGAPKDEKVTIYELKSYLDDRVPDYSRQYKGKSQFPYTFSKGRDFPLVIISKP